MVSMRAFNDKENYNHDINFEMLPGKVRNTRRKIRYVSSSESVAMPDLISDYVNSVESNMKSENPWKDIHDSVHHLLSLMEQLRENGYDLKSVANKIALTEADTEVLKTLVLKENQAPSKNGHNENSKNRFEFAYE